MLLEIAHAEDAHDPRYVVLHEGRSYLIGGGRADILLADSTVAPTHVRITLAPNQIVVEDLGSATGTFVDDELIHGPTVVEISQHIRIGETILKISLGERVPVPRLSDAHEPTPTEQAFVATLRANPADDATRIVYADWLEAESYRYLAHYIRLELAGNVDISTNEAVEKAVFASTVSWRAAISRNLIGGCPTRGCPRRWHLLAPTPKEFERTCATCKHRVYFCSTPEETELHGQTRDRVVLDSQRSSESYAEIYFHGRYREPGAYVARSTPRLFPEPETEDD